MHIPSFQDWCIDRIKQIPIVVWNLYEENSYLLASIGQVALNAILLLGALVKRIPASVSTFCFTLLSFTGLLTIPMQAKDAVKNTTDFRLAWHFHSYGRMALAAIRVCIKTANIFLTFATMAGAFVALAGFPSQALAVFSALRPISLAALVGTIADDIGSYFWNHHLVDKMEHIKTSKDTDKKIQAVAQNFLYFASQSPYGRLDEHIQVSSESLKEQKLALDLITQIDIWTLDFIKEGLAAKQIGTHRPLTNKEAHQIFDTIEKAFKQKITLTKVDLVLRTLGYISIGLSRLFPMTAIQYGLTLAMSLLYMMKTFFERYVLATLKNHLVHA